MPRAPVMSPEIHDIGRLPSKPFAKFRCHLLFRLVVISTNRQGMISRNSCRIDHYLAIDCIECFNDARIREFALSLFAERIGIAHGQ